MVNLMWTYKLYEKNWAHKSMGDMVRLPERSRGEGSRVQQPSEPGSHAGYCLGSNLYLAELPHCVSHELFHFCHADWEQIHIVYLSLLRYNIEDEWQKINAINIFKRDIEPKWEHP